MSDMPAALLDCDGVIVDNVAFEQQVTRTIIDAYASSVGSSFEEAEKHWHNELVATKGHPQWYDYAFHCDRLGLDGQTVSRNAHYKAVDLLSFVDGFQDTYLLLQEYGIEVGVVSDATNWVVKFKLENLHLNTIPFIFGSNDAFATKASAGYWKQLSAQFEYPEPRVLVDNRTINLSAAGSLLPEMCLVQFQMQEHVMTLPSKVAPESAATDERAVEIVHSHTELQRWIRNNFG
jgi:phosphoglycolate phosphatase-like HAD superfamily hydrolase